MQAKNRLLIVGAISLLLCITVVETGYAQKARSTSIVTIGDESYYVHTVVAGETLYSLSKLYNITEKEIAATNPQVIEGLQPMQVLKIKAQSGGVATEGRSQERKQAKIFDQHIVNHGETAYAICKRYGLPLNVLVEDNLGIDPTALALGQKLNIRKTSVGDSDPNQIEAQLEKYRDATNSVLTEYKVHIVSKGETLYSLGKLYDVKQDEITELNSIIDGLKIGMMIKIPSKQLVVATTPDSSIAQPETTVFEDNSTEHNGLGRQTKSIIVREFRADNPLNVAMLLPLQTGSTNHRNFLEFYQGALLALEDLKSKGISIDLNIYNTGRSAHEVAAVIDNKAFKSTDLIIGPIYEECVEPAISFAEHNNIAVVSPLANMAQVQSHVLYQLSPEPSSKYEKLKSMLAADKNIVVISMANNDPDFEKEISAVLPASAKHFNYSKSSPITSLESLISGDKDNVYVVLSNNDSSVDEFLARISSVQNNLLARSIKNANINIIGTSKWLRFQNIDKNLYFKLGLTFITSYHADRSNSSVLAFDKRYIAAFGSIPTLYSYRGYDAMKLFAGTINHSQGQELTSAVNNTTTQLLQMPYRFKQLSHNGNNVNGEWAKVNYKSDYTIVVE